MVKKPIDNEVLVHMYANMLRIRMVELAIEGRYREDEMRTPIHASIGQEAVPVGVCTHLRPGDLVFSNHRSHAHYLAKGGDLKSMLAELYNRATGCTQGRGGSMHLIDRSAGFSGSSAIVGGGIALAAGAALAFALQSKNNVAVTFFGDGAAEEGVLYESVNFAALKDLPVIYVCENNLYSVCSPLSNRQKPRPIYKRFEGFDIACRQVDGNDVEEVYSAFEDAGLRARLGLGPSFLECMTYRMRDHHGTKTGVEAGYQSREEWEAWNERCPLRILEARLKEKGLLTPSLKNDLICSFQKEIASAFAFARNSRFPDPDTLLDWLYV